MSEIKILCPLKYLNKTFGGKWKLPIICVLSNKKSHRYSAIRRKLGDITNMMLSQSLKELEADGLIKRNEFNEVPPHVEYSLSEKGERVLPFLTSAAEWAVKEMGFENIEAFCNQCVKL